MDTLLNSGDILNSRYRILHQIRHGGFGRTQYCSHKPENLMELGSVGSVVGDNF